MSNNRPRQKQVDVRQATAEPQQKQRKEKDFSFDDIQREKSRRSGARSSSKY
jgi:hypothetical protein